MWPREHEYVDVAGTKPLRSCRLIIWYIPWKYFLVLTLFTTVWFFLNIMKQWSMYIRIGSFMGVNVDLLIIHMRWTLFFSLNFLMGWESQLSKLFSLKGPMSAQLFIQKGLSQKLCLEQWRRMLSNIYSSPILLQYLVGYIYLLVNWYSITILAKLLSMQTPSLQYKGSIPCSQHKDCSSSTQVRVQRFDWNFMTFWVHFWWSSLAIFRGKKKHLSSFKFLIMREEWKSELHRFSS